MLEESQKFIIVKYLTIYLCLIDKYRWIKFKGVEMAGLYIHIPFCENKCSYCDFVSFANKKDSIDSYFKALLKEIELQADNYREIVFETIYFGGGTPSFVDVKYIEQTMLALKKFFAIKKDAEVTIEMNPNSATAEKIERYKQIGINRFSIGLQTAIDRQLKEIGRVHTLQDFENIASFLQGENFNVDIMLGLKQQTIEDILYSLAKAIEVNASHISVYALTPEENTPIYKDYLAGVLPTEEETANFYKVVVDKLKQNGFLRYEVSNFAKKGKESKHNLLYWHAKQYLGLGLSASSYMQQRRFKNTTNLQQYLLQISQNILPIVECTTIDAESAKFEYIMLAFRLEEGLNVKEYEKLFCESFEESYAHALHKNKAYLKRTEDRIAIREEYIYVQNQILVDFLK